MQRRTFLHALGLSALASRLAWALPDSPAQAFSVLCLAFSPSGEQVAAGGCEEGQGQKGVKGSIRIYQAATGQETGRLEGHGQATNGLYWVNEERLISWGSQEWEPDGDGPPRDQRIRIWSLLEKRMEREVRLEDRFPSRVLFHARQADVKLFWSCPDGILLWHGGRIPERMLAGGAELRGLSLDGQRVLYQDGGLNLFELASRKRHGVRDANPQWASGLPDGGWLTYDAQNGYQSFDSELTQVVSQVPGPPPVASSALSGPLVVVHEQGLLVYLGAGAPRQIPAVLPGRPLALHPPTRRAVTAEGPPPRLRWLEVPA